MTGKPLPADLARMVLLWGLLLEIPIRYLIFPDPWLREPGHWYFGQPTRALIEGGFVVAALLPFLVLDGLAGLVEPRLDRRQALFLVIGIPSAVVLFAVMEWSEVQVIQGDSLWAMVPLWFATGLLMGIGQELTFRGLILTGLQATHGTRTAVVASMALFVLGPLHGPRMYAYATNGFASEALTLLVLFTVSGLFFTWVRTRTRHVMVPAMLHGFGNAVTWGTVFVVKLNS
jgi:membrane protease YdiL (CAAX protease family)